MTIKLLKLFMLRNCKCRVPLFTYPKRLNSEIVQAKLDFNKLQGDPDYIAISETWKADTEQELRAAVVRDMQVYPNFVSEAEENQLLAELEPYLKRMRYEYDHWDNAIEGYRETERSKWSPENQAVLDRVRALAFPDGQSTEPLPHAHVLDLAAAGYIKPHVDAVRFCGDVIAGLCLLSSAVMRLVHTDEPHLQLDALLARRCLYVMRGVARYSFTHAVLSAEDSVWRGVNGERVPRQRRLAVICRSRPSPHNRD